jgi:hypothetical protein
VQLERAQLYDNIVGNVLCRPGDTGQISMFGDSEYSSDAYDTRVTNTMVFHGNFDYVSNSTQWSPSIDSHSLPPSLYLTTKPAFFGNLAWPPFGPSPDGSTVSVQTIPALERWIARFGKP